ncbi:MAG: hypothetical protein ACP5QY_12275, partial [Candidatus Hydrogenedens sp.]
MKKVICFTVVVITLCLAVSVPVYSVDITFLNKVRSEEKQAYAEISNGQVKNGLCRLARLFRDAPLDDISCIEPLLGPFQLFCYELSTHNELIMQSLVDRNVVVNSGREEPVLQPNMYPSDRLLMAGAYALSEPMDTFSHAHLYHYIPQLIGDKEILLKAVGVGLGLVIFPEGGEALGIPGDYYRSLSIPYMRKQMSVEIQRLFVEVYVLMRIDELSGAIKEMGSYGNELSKRDDKTLLLDKLEEWGITREEVVSISPGLNCISLGLPSLDVKDINWDSFLLWADMLRKTSDSRVGYMLLFILRYSPYFGEEVENKVRGVLEDICKEVGSTGRVEGIYARCILNDWDARSHRVKDLYMRTKELLQTGVLPGVYSFRSLYKERERAINLAYNYFVKYCWYEYGVEIGDAMRSRDWMSKELFK